MRVVDNMEDSFVAVVGNWVVENMEDSFAAGEDIGSGIALKESLEVAALGVADTFAQRPPCYSAYHLVSMKLDHNQHTPFGFQEHLSTNKHQYS
jgi:hypothetical protein